MDKNTIESFPKGSETMEKIATLVLLVETRSGEIMFSTRRQGDSMRAGMHRAAFLCFGAGQKKILSGFGQGGAGSKLFRAGPGCHFSQGRGGAGRASQSVTPHIHRYSVLS